MLSPETRIDSIRVAGKSTGRTQSGRRRLRLGYRRRGNQVLDEPLAGRTGRDLETTTNVGVEVAAGHEDDFLRVRGGLVGLARELAGDEAVVRRNDHEQRRRGDPLEILAWLIALEELQRAHRHLVLP